MNIPKEKEEEKKKRRRKKERPNTCLVYNHSGPISMVLIFNETTWKGIWVDDIQTVQKESKNKQRIVKAWTVR